MASTIENATFANAVYGESSSLPDGWEVMAEWPLNDGYSGRAFINKLTKEIVIAHKGSDDPISDPGDWWNNAEHAFNTQFSETFQLGVGDPWSDQLKESEAFVKSIMNSPAAEGYSVSQTGHSLGGFLASVNGAKFKSKAEAFDPPASTEYLEYLQQKSMLTQEQLEFAHNNTTSHLSKGSFIDVKYNPEDYHGTVNQFNLGEDLDGFDLYQKHKMQNILDSYNQDTGKFRNSNLIKTSSETPAFEDLLNELDNNLNSLRNNLN